ncbi:MAG: response regulator [Alphaproteobacteria bacterium]|nr:response regulator [Alphaproteobacteria bacterium]
MFDLDVENLSVLVVDDHMVIRRLIESFLRENGFQNIDIAANCDEVMQKLEFHKYDIVFFDWNLPGKSGYAQMQELRENRAYDTMAIVMVTAESEERHVIEALKAGATAYIIKPVARETFDKNLEKVVSWLARVRNIAAEKKQGGPV